MSLILARSPYFVDRGSLGNDASLAVEIGYINESGSQVILKTYALVFRNKQKLDISPFIRDYLEGYDVLTVKTYLNGSIDDVEQAEVVGSYLATDGYSYFEEGYNLDKSVFLEDNLFYAGSNDLIYRYSNEGLRLPFLHSKVTSPYNVTVSYYEGDDLFYSQPLVFSNNNQTSIKVNYVTDYVVFNLSDGGTNEIEDGIGNILQVAKEMDEDSSAYVTKVVIDDGNDNTKELTVVTIDKCKYEPFKVQFRNKLGLYEDLWFFKKSVKSISTSKESYRANTLDSFSSGVLKHQNQEYNLNAKESIVLNTGFLPESFNENIKQLLLSESVFLEYDNISRPVNVRTSELQYKQHVNDKLINYTIEFEFAHEVINNVS